MAVDQNMDGSTESPSIARAMASNAAFRILIASISAAVTKEKETATALSQMSPKASFSRLGGHRLGIIQSLRDIFRVQNDCCGADRARRGSTANFVDSRNRAEALAQQSAFDREIGRVLVGSAKAARPRGN